MIKYICDRCGEEFANDNIIKVNVEIRSLLLQSESSGNQLCRGCAEMLLNGYTHNPLRTNHVIKDGQTTIDVLNEIYKP